MLVLSFAISVVLKTNNNVRRLIMKCIKCGFEFDEGLFCPECGTKYDEILAREIEEKEKAEREAELLRLQNEKMRLEQEKQEKLVRTFNGMVYASVEEMQVAKAEYEKQMLAEKAQKKIDRCAVLSFVLSMATYVLTMTIFLWLPAYVLSIIWGVQALKGKTKRKGFAIAGLVIDALMIVLLILILVLSFS